ncbi:hypothetical protein C6503_08520 [Candidatus Poribacteria bacterium]|nr:MAG: hypothetical protein C6503_08520 [Candidatus Poribacteria bacterium]
MHLPLKEYQERTLETLTEYYQKCLQYEYANTAFYDLTQRPYAALEGLPGMSWVRNLERKPQHPFSLQTSTDKFYPDFVCLLTDGRYLVVEYKGRQLWSADDAKEKREIGELWEARSGEQCLFIMPNGPDFDAIRAKLSQNLD